MIIVTPHYSYEAVGRIMIVVYSIRIVVYVVLISRTSQLRPEGHLIVGEGHV